jgi:hypothetical protein
MLMIAGFVAIVLEIGVFVAIGYGELKVAVRELRGGA